MIIYRIYNKINGKSYIGQSVKNCFNQRYIGGKWWVKPSNSYLIRAAERYGVENFEIQILENNIESVQKLYELEIFYAQKFNSYRPNGYNLIPCGVDKDKKELKHVLLGRDYNKPSTFTSKYKGVFYRKSNDRWTCNFNNILIKKSKTLNSEIEAAEMYDKVAIYLYGDDAFINFEHKRSFYLDLDLEEFYINEFCRRNTSNRVSQKKDYTKMIELIEPLLWKFPIPEISKMIGYSEKKIRYCIKSNNIDSPGKYFWHQKGKFNVKDDSEIVNKIKPLLEKNSIKEISDILGYTCKKIRYYVNKHKLKINQKND